MIILKGIFCRVFFALAVMLVMFALPGNTETVKAQDTVNVEVTYIYVNEQGENSVCMDTQTVKAGTTWGEFFNSYQTWYQNGTITNAACDDNWEIDVQCTRWGSQIGTIYPEVIRNFNQYQNAALVTYYGYGYAKPDGTLMTNTDTYDWNGNQVYLQGDGHVQGTGDGRNLWP